MGAHEIRGDATVLVPVVAEHVGELRRILLTPEVRSRWGDEAAIRCYAGVGFRPVAVMRSYERDVDGSGWHDGLLMDLLADELEKPR